MSTPDESRDENACPLHREHGHVCVACGRGYTCLFGCSPTSHGMRYCKCDACSEEADDA